MALVTGLSFEAGYIIIQMDSGPPVRQDVASVLTALAIPTGLTYRQVGAIKTLANLWEVALKALIERDLIGDDLFGGYDLPTLFETLQGIGGDFGEPDLTVT